MKFRKKPVVIDAFHLGWNDLPDWFMDHVSDGRVTMFMEKAAAPNGRPFEGHCMIRTLEGVMRANAGDWVIKGVSREIYPCKPEIFAATYEPVSE